MQCVHFRENYTTLEILSKYFRNLISFWTTQQNFKRQLNCKYSNNSFICLSSIHTVNVRRVRERVILLEKLLHANYKLQAPYNMFQQLGLQRKHVDEGCFYQLSKPVGSKHSRTINARYDRAHFSIKIQLKLL